jgi:uncharacterized protein
MKLISSLGLSSARLMLTALALGTTVVPAIADVKDGVDAWGRGEFEAAVKEWRTAALKGDPDAQFNMGQAYKMGRGVKQDLDVALDWYRRAAQQGHTKSADSYGHLLYYKGMIRESLPYLQASSTRGEPRSQYYLATELFNGTNIAKDWVRSYALMTRASSSGMSAASRSLAQMDQYIPLEQRQEATVLASELERQAGQARSDQLAGFPINTAPPAAIGQPIEVPPSVASESDAPGFPTSIDPAPPTGPATKSSVTKPRAMPPIMRPAEPTEAPVRTAAVQQNGKWRIQLGAFGDESNARKLWTSLSPRVSGLSSFQPYLKAAGSITRLQAGPFASKNDAEEMCAKVKSTGQSCIAVMK